MSVEFGILVLIAVLQLLNSMRHRDCEERIHMARQQAQRETHNQWAAVHRNAMNIYRESLRDGRVDLGKYDQSKDGGESA